MWSSGNHWGNFVEDYMQKNRDNIMNTLEKQGYSDIEDICRRLYPDLFRAFGYKMEDFMKKYGAEIREKQGGTK